MTAYTSSQSGNWSNSATWGGSGVPGDGDTVSIGAHTVTVDVNTTVGTSPNNNTTKVIDRTSGSARLVLAAGVILTVKGNFGGVNAVSLEFGAGAGVVFDPSASGGTPVYTFVNVGGEKLVCAGTVSSRCSISAVPGHSWKIGVATAFNGVTYTDFLRASTFQVTNAALNSTGTDLRHCAWDDCGVVDISQASATLNFTFEDNIATNSRDTLDSFKIALATAATTSVRKINRNYADKSMNLSAGAKNIAEFDNNVLGGLTCAITAAAVSFTRPPRNNFIRDPELALNTGNGMRFVGSWDGLYCVVEKATGNPHYIAPYAPNAQDETYRRVVFENQSADLIDTGDCFLPQAACCASGQKISFENCIALPKDGSGVQAGQLITSYNPSTSNNTTHQLQARRNTVNQNKTSVVGIGARAAFAVAEASVGAADQLSELKSNLVWAAAANDGYLAERISGTVKDIITASGADYNWTYNLGAGDNLRGYEDRAGSGDLWTAGDAVDATVDANQGAGDPDFVDDARCMATWAVARGYGSTYADAVAALRVDRLRVTDLINYIFEGYKPQNATMRNHAHDGGCVGAANWHKASRSLTQLAALQASAESRFGIAA